MYNENNKCAELAKEFLAGKERKDYYEIMAFDEDDMTEVRFLQGFSEDELNALRALREKYGKEDFVKHLDEVYPDPDDIHDLTCGRDILGIDLDVPYHQYRFVRHELKGDTLTTHDALVELTDEQYVRLLSYCLEDKGMNVNKLRYADKVLHERVIRDVDLDLCFDDCYSGNCPYLITMDEVKEDAERILAENPDLHPFESIGYMIF